MAVSRVVAALGVLVVLGMTVTLFVMSPKAGEVEPAAIDGPLPASVRPDSHGMLLTTDTLYSPLSPGLKVCKSNPFLAALELTDLAEAERHTIEFFGAQHVATVQKHAKLRAAQRKHIDYALVGDTKHPYPCPGGLKRHGNDGDGGKWLCGLAQLTSTSSDKPCVVYSLGSGGRFGFEESMLEETTCVVRTYDCTTTGRDLGKRFTYIQKCLGNARMDGNREYVPLQRAMQDNHDATIDLLKMDIEGFEHEVYASMLVEHDVLPFQISFESHAFSKTLLDTPLKAIWHYDMFRALLSAGYRLVALEPNPDCKSCMEFTVMRYFC